VGHALAGAMPVCGLSHTAQGVAVSQIDSCYRFQNKRQMHFLLEIWLATKGIPPAHTGRLSLYIDQAARTAPPNVQAVVTAVTGG